MKIKEVCAQTGLTERAVRLYLEKGLLSPKSQWYQGRIYREYSPEDVERLREIGALRSVGFSLEDIREMLQNGGKTDDRLSKRLEELTLNSAETKQNLELLQKLPLSGWKDGAELAQAVLKANISPGKVDSQPDFGKEDGLTREEKRSLAHQATQNLERRGRWQRILTWGAMVAVLVFLLVGGLVYRYETQLLSMVSFTQNAYLSTPARAENSSGEIRMAAWITIPEENMRFLGVFRGEAGNALYDSFFADTLYEMISYKVEIPRREAQKLGLMQEGTDFLDTRKVQEKMMSDSNFCFQYLSVTQIQAEAKNGNPDFILLPNE